LLCSAPWQWEKIKANSGFIVQYHGEDDPFIPVHEARFVAKQLNLNSEYHEEPEKNHYLSQDFQDLVDLIEYQCKGRIAYTAPHLHKDTTSNIQSNV
jgi:pimeloyl-ACP methyl ester carboxylesterase